MNYLTSLAQSQYHVFALVIILLVRAQQREVWVRSTGLCQHIPRSSTPTPHPDPSSLQGFKEGSVHDISSPGPRQPEFD